MNAAEFVVGNVDGTGEEPEQSEREKTCGKPLAGAVLTATREENGGECGTGHAERGDIFSAIRADAKKLRGNPHQPGDGISKDEEEPSFSFHAPLAVD
jgi:hypothetical protein